MRRTRVGATFFLSMVTTLTWTLVMVAKNRQEASGIRPWVGAVYFYWYEWDELVEWGNWLGGVHNTPLYGYYDNRKINDNFRSLLLACDWGFTHFFLDYWGAPWRGEGGEARERTVLRAAEKVASLGYPIRIGYYQDGTNFAMKDFSLNISEKRDTYHWLKEFAGSPLWTRLAGKPFQMVYARNGLPQETPNDSAFRMWLRQRYGTIHKLNYEWQTSFSSFDDISMNFSQPGPLRAFSIAFQFEMWKESWARLEELIRKETGFPGLIASFDAGYGPFKGYGFEKFIRTFGGSHSYAGIFGLPHQMDAQRFLHAAIARKLGTIFFDHLKHRYFDWDIRVPGTAYPPDPFHYDRFWIGNLMRPLDGVLHLSWNEWWEGSNLEPSMENGKTYCEKNLLYSTLWQITYPYDRTTKRSEVALVVNDWIFEHGGGIPDDLYNAVQGLRSSNIPFDLLLQSEINDQVLSHYRVVVAPSGSLGFGFNNEHLPIQDVLEQWLQQGDRVLILSRYGPARRTPSPSASLKDPSATTRKGFNYFVDVGVAGDEQNLISGFSYRENWGLLPPTAYGAGTPATVRWTPDIGNKTSFLLPSLPRSDHVLRWHGNAIWSNRLTVRVHGIPVGDVYLQPGWRLYEVTIPATVAIGKVMEVTWEFEQTHIPGEKEPQKFRGEGRVCNLAVDWVQISTPEIPPGERKSVAWTPIQIARFRKPLTGSFQTPLVHRSADLPSKTVLSTYEDGLPRDLLIRGKGAKGEFQKILINGIFTDDPQWWSQILDRFAKLPARRIVVSPDLPHNSLMSHIRRCGGTQFVLVENRALQPAALSFSILSDTLPLAEIVIVSRDGHNFSSLNGSIGRRSGRITFSDRVQYYGVYQIVWSPVRINTAQWTFYPGQKGYAELEIENLVNRPVKGHLQLKSVIASVKGESVPFSLSAFQRQKIRLPVRVADFADWGVKTVFIEVRGTGGSDDKVVFLRPLVIGKPSSVHSQTSIGCGPTLALTISNSYETPFGRIDWGWCGKQVPMDEARDIWVYVEDLSGRRLGQASLDRLTGGQSQVVNVNLKLKGSQTRWLNGWVVITWRDHRGHHQARTPIRILLFPQHLAKQQNAVAVAAITGVPVPLNLPFFLPLPDSLAKAPLSVADHKGRPVLAYVDQKQRRLTVFPSPSEARTGWTLDVGTKKDQDLILSGVGHPERWSGGVTIRWIPVEGAKTVLTLPVRPHTDHLLTFTGFSLATNKAHLTANGQSLGSWAIKDGWQKLSQVVPEQFIGSQSQLTLTIEFEKSIRPAEILPGNTDQRVCNFALDDIQLIPVYEDLEEVLYLFTTSQQDETVIPVVRQGSVVRIDNGALIVEWDENQGGTLTKLLSQQTGRDYAAAGLGVGVGVFGLFNPKEPAITTDRFVRDDIKWQRERKGTIKVVDQTPAFATIEVSASGIRNGYKFRSSQRYRLYKGCPLIEIESKVFAEALGKDGTEGAEVVALEGRFQAGKWSKSYPNFVGLGDQPPEVYGPITHYGWRMGSFVPPVVCFYDPENLDETLSLLLVHQKGLVGVRQGFWGERRTVPAGRRKYATVEFIGALGRPITMKAFLVLHPGHHREAKALRDWLLGQNSLLICR
ncbi:MAG: beta-galactosidase [Armatimonadetes bacterium]|nr:beta-galactosidase [Armatimonadota bacterium]MDW8122486.1 beta-galactosidase [Armatimonadota bacterium]